jgi:hypothetical protein
MTLPWIIAALLAATTLTACSPDKCGDSGPTSRTRRAGHTIVHERCIDHEWKRVSP